jgi:hypothetical protein
MGRDPDFIPNAGPLQIGDPVRAAVARARGRRSLREANLSTLGSNPYFMLRRGSEGTGRWLPAPLYPAEWMLETGMKAYVSITAALK